MIFLPALFKVKGHLLYVAGVVPEDSEIAFKMLSADLGSDTWVSFLLQTVTANEAETF